MFRLSGITVHYDERLALDGIDLEIPCGKVCVVMGPNGAGKTTLMRVLGGTLVPSSGEMDWPAHGGRVRAAVVGQTVALYPFLTIRENCLASGRMEGLRGHALAAMAETAMQRTLCDDLADRLAGRLSGGYQRRAAIAAALMVDAPLLILDEPTTGLDRTASAAVVEVIERLRKTGRTIVLSTHDFDLADAVADEAVFLRGGTLAAAGSPQRLRAVALPRGARVELVLAAQPTASQAAALIGLEAVRRGTDAYDVLAVEGSKGLLDFVQRLHEANIAVREMHVREHGTAMLFAHICLEEGVA